MRGWLLSHPARRSHCDQYWGSHGCDLPPGHAGPHRCGDLGDPCSELTTTVPMADGEYPASQARFFQSDGTWSEWLPTSGFTLYAQQPRG